MVEPSSQVAPVGDYYGHERADLVAALPRPLGTVLDIGCGAGGNARALRSAGAEFICGIERFPPAAEVAATYLLARPAWSADSS